MRTAYIACFRTSLRCAARLRVIHLRAPVRTPAVTLLTVSTSSVSVAVELHPASRDAPPAAAVLQSPHAPAAPQPRSPARLWLLLRLSSSSLSEMWNGGSSSRGMITSAPSSFCAATAVMHIGREKGRRSARNHARNRSVPLPPSAARSWAPSRLLARGVGPRGKEWCDETAAGGSA